MARLNKDHLDKWYDHHINLELRTIYIGANSLHMTDGYGADEISPYITENVIKGLTLLETKPEPIKIILNSPGGDLYQGLAIYDALKRSPCDIEILATGQCMSAASIILQAATKRSLSENCIVMVHNGEDANVGSPDDVYNWAKFGKHMNKVMYKIYAQASNKPESYWARKCEKDYILTAEEAVNEGLADEII